MGKTKKPDWADQVHGIVCYWEWATPEHRDKRHWRLVESFPIDSDGYSLTTPSTGGGDRHETDKWMNHRVLRTEDGTILPPEREDEAEFDDWEPIPGRAVTIWTMGNGVWLKDFSPPGEDLPKWMAIDFCEKLCKKKDWSSYLERGYDMYFGTIREAERYISFKEKEPDGEVQASKD